MKIDLNKLETVIPLVCIGVSVVIFTPIIGIHLGSKTGLYIHFISFLILGILFEIPELSLNVWCLFKLRSKDWLKQRPLLNRIFTIRYILTHFVAPSSGILTLASGLYLIAVDQSSLTQGWLFWLLVTSTIGLYKGIVQHRFYIKKMMGLIKSEKDSGQLAYYMSSPFDHLLIFSECPTYFLNYWLACRKPAWLPNPFSNLILNLEQTFGSRAWVGVMLVGTGSLLIFLLIFLMKKFSRVYYLRN